MPGSQEGILHRSIRTRTEKAPLIVAEHHPEWQHPHAHGEGGHAQPAARARDAASARARRRPMPIRWCRTPAAAPRRRWRRAPAQRWLPAATRAVSRRRRPATRHPAWQSAAAERPIRSAWPVAAPTLASHRIGRARIANPDRQADRRRRSGRRGANHHENSPFRPRPWPRRIRPVRRATALPIREKDGRGWHAKRHWVPLSEIGIRSAEVAADQSRSQVA